MKTLAPGPTHALRTITNTGAHICVNVVCTIYELRIADAVPADGAITINELASKVGAHRAILGME